MKFISRFKAKRAFCGAFEPKKFRKRLYNTPYNQKFVAKSGLKTQKRSLFGLKSDLGRHLVDIQDLENPQPLEMQEVEGQFGRHLVDILVDGGFWSPGSVKKSD